MGMFLSLKSNGWASLDTYQDFLFLFIKLVLPRIIFAGFSTLFLHSRKFSSTIFQLICFPKFILKSEKQKYIDKFKFNFHQSSQAMKPNQKFPLIVTPNC